MIVLLSLNFKNTPLKIREYFAFEIADRKKLLISLCEEEFIDEAALLITCNRTEIYISSSYEQMLGKIVNIILKKCEMLIKKSLDNIRDYVYIFSNRSAIAHLYRVSAGLDSMVLGEDQILGQVKDAIEFARECGTAGLYLNTFIFSNNTVFLFTLANAAASLINSFTSSLEESFT